MIIIDTVSGIGNKVVLITGGATRIGACIAKTLHHNGMNIVIHYHSSELKAKQLQKTLCKLRADSVHLVKADLNKKQSAKILIEKSIDHFGRLDVLINNAANFFAAPVTSISESHWEQLMHTNFKAPYFLIQHAVPQLKKQRGCIINITDIYATQPIAEHSLYCASKAALTSISQSLAAELGPEIRVNAIAPGAILWPNPPPDEVTKKRITNKTALKRVGNGDDIAKTTLFLIRDADYITGQIIAVDGGRSLFI